MLVHARVHGRSRAPHAGVADKHAASACGQAHEHACDRAPPHQKRPVMPAAPHPIHGEIDAEGRSFAGLVAGAVRNK